MQVMTGCEASPYSPFSISDLPESSPKEKHVLVESLPQLMEEAINLVQCQQ